MKAEPWYDEYVRASDRAMKLETERDEAKGNLEAWRFHAAAWGTDPDEVRKYIKKLERERDELREKVERAEAKTHAEYDAHRMTQCERDALRAEVETLKADKARLIAGIRSFRDFGAAKHGTHYDVMMSAYDAVTKGDNK